MSRIRTENGKTYAAWLRDLADRLEDEDTDEQGVFVEADEVDCQLLRELKDIIWFGL